MSIMCMCVCAGRDALAVFLIPHSILIAALREGDGEIDGRKERFQQSRSSLILGSAMAV